ncbi:MAG: hypothetical protein IJ637_01470 [Prevotella sp.]|nr:hypothetical protein [Prevotella sp.]
MKKVMMMAMMLVASAAAFAGDSPALKAIMKAKAYAEAEQLLKSTFDQLANDEEKAKAYNKLVDLAMVKVNEEGTKITENQANAQLGIDKKKEVDNVGMCDALINALNNAYECNKYDQLPNAKGKVAPKFAEKNVQRLWANHFQLVAVGDDFRQKNDYPNVIKYWIPYLDAYTNPFFASQNRDPEKETFEQLAFLTSWIANNQKEYDIAVKYSKMALQSEKFKDDAQRIMLAAMGGGLKNRQDSLNYVKKVEALYKEDPSNESYINALYNAYGDLQLKKEQKDLLEGILAKDPKNFIALANMGIMYIGENDYAQAVPFLRRAVEVRDTNPNVLFYLGTSLCMIAQDVNTDNGTAQQKKEAQEKKDNIYREAIKYLDKCKELDPEKQQINWGYNRQNAYYNLYGPESPEYKQAEADYKN